VDAEGPFILQDVRDAIVYGQLAGDHIGLSLDTVGDVNGDGYEEFVTVTRGRSPLPYSGYLFYGGPSFPEILDLAAIPARAVIEVVTASRMGSVGDFNGDGYCDFAIATVGYDLPPVYDVGRAMIVYGTAELPGEINLPEPGLPGVIIEGHRSGEWVGNDMRAIGDVNGDGFDDFGFQGWRVRGNNIAEVVFIYGGTDVPDYLSTDDLGEHGSMIISAFPADQLGDSFAPAGDVNGDGFDDVIIGANAFEPGDPDRAYLVFGGTDLPPLIKADELGKRGIVFTGSGEDFGKAVTGVGDANRDGLADFAIGAPGKDANGLTNSGAIHLIFGASEFPTSLNVDQLGNRGILITGTEEWMTLGQDFSGPGYWKDAIYPVNMTRPRNSRNEVFLLFGGTGYASAGTFPIEDMEPVVIYNPLGTNNYPNVMRFGDINGDGYDDLIIGEEFGSILKEGGGYERFNCGMVHIIYGSPEKFGLPTPTPTPTGVGDFSGWMLLGTGEVVRTTPLPPTPTPGPTE